MKSLFALLAVAFTGTAMADAPRPNVIFVLCDDMGWGDLGIFYQNSRTSTQKFATPKLDAFASEGLQLRRHYAPAPVCAPSRASLILGVHQGHSNIRNNQFDQTLDNNHTLGTVMKGAGYATACIGKWGLQGPGTPENQPSHPSKRGFDYFFGYIAHLAAHYHYPEELTGNDNQGQPNAFFENTTNITSQLAKCYSTDLITARAKKWISDQHTASPAQPFFLYLTYAAPHAQLDVPTQAYPAGDGLDGGVQWLGTSGNMINTASGTINSWIHPDYASQAGWTDAAKRHATMMRRIDDSMGDLVATLDELGIDDNTLIVFTSDNGPANEAGSGGTYTHDPRFFGSYGPFEGIKRDVLEGGMRVPALVRWPSGISAGGISQTPSQFQDWLPTFAELAGVPQPERTDGASLVPTLTGTGTQHPSTIYVEYSIAGNTPNWTAVFPNHANDPRNEMQVLFLNGYKGIRTNVGSHSDDFRIYNTLTDPAESTNLAGQTGIPTQQQFKDKVLQLRRTSSDSPRSYIDSQPVPPPPSVSAINGLEWKAYEKSTPWVPNWETETPVASGNTTTPDLAVRTRDTDIGVLFSGYLKVPSDGDYTFDLSTDTGAFVRLHDLQLIDADFGYSAGTQRSSGTIKLKAGYHPIEIHYRHANAASHLLDLQWTGPGIAKQAIPASAYYRDGIPVPVPPVANPDSASLSSSSLIDVLANDSDDGSPSALAISSVTRPAHGTAVVEGTAIRYTPAAGFLGVDHFTYTITDGADTSTASVSVSVIPATTSIWLPFDESEGTIAHDVLGRPLGTLTSFPASPWTTGKLGNALSFDGTDDRVSLTGQKGITGTAARTVSFWINANASQASGTRPTIVSWGAGNSSATGTRFDINLNHTNGYKLRAEFNASGVNFTTPARSDLRGAGWVHCAIVMPANATVSQVQAYIDGVLATPALEPTTSGTVALNTSSTNDIAIGRIADGTAARAFGGIIDDVRIYPMALDAARIAALATETPEKNKQGAWYFRHSGNDSPNHSDWNSDQDGDGFIAWLEYALGGNPTSHDRDIAPEFSDGVFRFNRRKDGIPSTAYHPKVSESLQTASWTPLAGFTVAQHPDMPDFEIVSVPLPPSPAPSRFVRLEVDE